MIEEHLYACEKCGAVTETPSHKCSSPAPIATGIIREADGSIRFKLGEPAMKTSHQLAAEAADNCAKLIPTSFGVTARDFQSIIETAIKKATEPEFYDQRKWIAQHNIADEHIYDNIGRTVVKAVYYSPAYRESRAAHASEKHIVVTAFRKEGE